MHRWITADTLLHVGETELRFSWLEEAHLARVGGPPATRAHNASHQINFKTSRCPSKKRNSGCIVAIYGLSSGHAFCNFLLLIRGRLRKVGFKNWWVVWCLRYANGHSKPLSDSPRLNHQINIPSKGSSEPMVWGELSAAAV